MTIRKSMKAIADLDARSSELYNRRIFIRACRAELEEKQKLLASGDISVADRINELFEIIDDHVAWINRNVPIIKRQLAS